MPFAVIRTLIPGLRIQRLLEFRPGLFAQCQRAAFSECVHDFPSDGRPFSALMRKAHGSPGDTDPPCQQATDHRLDHTRTASLPSARMKSYCIAYPPSRCDLQKRIVRILTILLVLSVAGFATNYFLMRSERIVWEVGEGIRSRLDDLGADFVKGDPALIASYYAQQFTGSELGFAARHTASEEGGVLLEDWRAGTGEAATRDQFIGELLAYRANLGKTETAKFKMMFLNQYTANSASILMRFQVYAHDAQGHPVEDRGKFNVDLVRQEGEWRFTRQRLVEATRV